MSITLVGTASGSALNGGDITITLPGGMQQDDLVILAAGHKSGTSPAVGTSGYTQIRETVAGDDETRIRSWRKFMGASPDTSVTVTGTGNASDAEVAVVMVFRGVDTTTPMDATSTDSTGSSSNPDSPSITTVTNGAAVISIGGKFVHDTSITAPAGYGDKIDISASDTDPFSIAAAWITKATAGTENPPSWTTWLGAQAWCAQTVALRPAVGVGPTIVVPLKSFTLSKKTPAAASGKSAAVPLKSYDFNPRTPVVGISVKITVPLKPFDFTAYEPEVVSGGGVIVPLYTYTLDPKVPLVGTGRNIQIPAKNFVMQEFAPAVGAGASVAAPRHSYVLHRFSPTGFTVTQVNVPVKAFSFDAYAPIIQIGTPTSVFWLPPTPPDGFHCRFVVEAANGIQAVAGPTDTIRIETNVTAAGLWVKSTALGSALHLMYKDGEWRAIAKTGTWTM